MRAAEQKAKDEAKSARLRERPAANPEPRLTAEPLGARVPRQGAQPESILEMRMQLTRESQDCKGQWAWGLERCLVRDSWDAEIGPVMQHLTVLTWREISEQNAGGHRKHHEHEVSRIRDEAQTRWAEVGLAEFDTAYRFRLGNRPRLWGYRVGPVFHVVWWDPEHQIYPTEPR